MKFFAGFLVPVEQPILQLMFLETLPRALMDLANVLPAVVLVVVAKGWLAVL